MEHILRKRIIKYSNCMYFTAFTNLVVDREIATSKKFR